MLAEFGDVGLMTGDVTINPTATCLVMTTEVRYSDSLSKFAFLKQIDSTINALSWFRNYARSRMGHLR